MVVQRIGSEVNGGAEALCREVALAMSAIWDVTIISTTALDYLSWEPYYRAGLDALGPVRLQRFDVDVVRRQKQFDALSSRIIARGPAASIAEQEDWMRAQGPFSTTLLRYIEDRRGDYDILIFFTYLYATTYFGLPLVAEKAFLVPLAHDEWPIHFSLWDAFFRLPRRIVFSTIEERSFIMQRFEGILFNGPIIGTGVSIPKAVRPSRFRDRFAIWKPYVIYVGRVDKAKNCDRLMEDFVAYKNFFRDDLQLVMLGRSFMELPGVPDVHALGYVDEETKMDALAGSELLVNPSELESLSIVLLEAWSVSRPVLVNRGSGVLVGQCRRAQGGLWYAEAAEFMAAIRVLRSEVGEVLGKSGLRFVQDNYSWSRVIEAYDATYSEFSAGTTRLR